MTATISLDDFFLARCEEELAAESGMTERLQFLFDEAPAEVWATPGVTGTSPAPVTPSPVLVELARAVERLAIIDPTLQSPEQSLADTEALLAIQRQLRVTTMRRLADVQARELVTLSHHRSTRSWMQEHHPDGDARDAKLGLSLRQFPVLDDSLETLPVTSARKVLAALGQCRPHVDERDGLIDGLPGNAVIAAVVGNVVDLVARERCGMEDDDPLLAQLQAQTAQILAEGGSEMTRLEKAFTLLAQHVAPAFLAGRLEELVLAVVPSILEDRADNARTGLDLRLKKDGSGWQLNGELDLECGERLSTALAAEAAKDPRNVDDTAAAQELRDQGIDPYSDGLAGTKALVGPFDGPQRALPRDRKKRLHDALNRMLGRYLEHGLGGTKGKTPVQVNVTLTDRAVTGEPGALPARADSGAFVPRSLVRRWWCDSLVTAFVLSRGGKALRTVHSQRLLTGRERRALLIEGGGRCATVGCCPGRPDPLLELHAHHVDAFAKSGMTALAESVPLCDTSHFDVHHGRTVRLRDGRLLREEGWVTEDDTRF